VREVKSETQLFDCVLITDINYDRISPTSKVYIKEFNENSKIFLLTGNPGKVICEIILKEKYKGKILDFAVRFSDLSEDFLSNYVLAFKKILDVKTSK